MAKLLAMIRKRADSGAHMLAGCHHLRDSRTKVAFVWKVADKLRGHFKQHEYGSVILPLLALRRLYAVLVDTKQQVLAKAATNTSPLTMTTMLADDKSVAAQLRSYIHGLSHSAADLIALNNDKHQYKIALEHKAKDMMLDRQEANGVLFDAFFSNNNFQVRLLDYLATTYEEIRARA